jgi:hypothetical protein
LGTERECLPKDADSFFRRFEPRVNLPSVPQRMSKHPLSSPPHRVAGGKVPEWKRAEIAVLGKVPDAEAARLLRRSLSAVVRRRRGLHIPEFEKTPHRTAARRFWQSKDDEIVRKYTIDEAMRLLGRTRPSILVRRRLLGIRQHNPKRWTAKEDALFTKFNNDELAKKLRRSLSSIENRRTRLKVGTPRPGWRYFTPAEDALLGTASDVEIARRLGRHQSSVQTRRMKLGIPSIKRPWTPEEDKVLGTAPDADIARRIGRTEHAIRSRRAVLHTPKPPWPSRQTASHRSTRDVTNSRTRVKPGKEN